jgi:hypothetical protein
MKRGGHEAPLTPTLDPTGFLAASGAPYGPLVAPTFGPSGQSGGVASRSRGWIAGLRKGAGERVGPTGVQRARRTGWPAQTAGGTTTIGPSVVAPYWRDHQGAADVIYGRAMDGHTGWRFRADGGQWAAKFSGDCGPLQNFRRGRFAGATPSILYPNATVLPGTHAPLGGLPVLPSAEFRVT